MLASSPQAIRLIRGFFGAGLLIFLLIFSLKYGAILSTIDIRILSMNVAISIVIVFCNGLVLKWTTHAFKAPLTIVEAQILAALGSFANAAGGLPIGTAMTIGVLVARHKFDLRDVVIGKLVATGLAVGALASFVAVFGSDNASTAVITLFAVVGIAAPIVLWAIAKFSGPNLRHIGVLQTLGSPPLIVSGVALAIVVAVLMNISYWIVIHHYVPDLSFSQSVQMISASLMVGFILLANSVSGLQEIFVGLSATQFQLSFVAGIELGLFIRIGSLIASGIVLAFAWSWERLTKESR